MVKEKLAKAHEKAHGFYAYTEHGCAVAYAICEFGNFHILLILLSAGLLAGFGVLVVTLVLERIG